MLPKTMAYRAQTRATDGRPYGETYNFSVGDGALDIPKKTHVCHKTNNQPVILSEENRKRFSESKFC